VAAASAWTASALSSSSAQPLDVATKGFGLHMKLTLPRHWQVLPLDPDGPPPSEMVGLVHVGIPSSDQSQWWGRDIMLVNGARVHRAADVVSPQLATPDRSKSVAWPSDFFGYLSALPGVKVLSASASSASSVSASGGGPASASARSAARRRFASSRPEGRTGDTPTHHEAARRQQARRRP
jgi:hypothetical protein